MYVVEHNNQQMVVVAALVHLRNITLLCLEDPLQCVACRVDASEIVLGGCYVLALLYCVTVLLGVLHDVFSGLVCAYECAELVVCCRVSLTRELDVLLYDSSHILVNHVSAVKNLDYNAALCKVNLLDFVCRHGVEALNEVLGVVVKRGSRLVLCGGNPVLLTVLSVLLGDGLEVSTAAESCVNRVCGLLCSCVVSSHNVYSAELHRVGQLLL